MTKYALLLAPLLALTACQNDRSQGYGGTTSTGPAGSRTSTSDEATDMRGHNSNYGQNSGTSSGESAQPSANYGDTTGLKSSGEGGARAGQADQAISRSVVSALKNAGVSNDTVDSIRVRSSNGKVVLNGDVNSQSEKQKIDTTVRQIPGVLSVDNQLRIAGSNSSETLPDRSGTGGVGQGSNNSGTGTSDTTPNSSQPQDQRDHRKSAK